MGRSRLKLLPGGKGSHPDDPPGDSSNTPPDYREFLPKGETLFGILDEANEAAFRAQFPKLIPALDQFKQTIHEWQEKFKDLPSAAAKELAHALDWRIRIKPMVSEEEDDDEEYDLDDDDDFGPASCGTGTHLNLDPGETPFKVIMECVENVAFMFERLKKVYDWTQRIPAMLQTIRKEKEDAEGRYQKAADAINEQLMQWTWEEEARPSLDIAKFEESVSALRGLQFKKFKKEKRFLQGGAPSFKKNIDALEREGRRFQEASKKEENLGHIQTFLAEQLPDPSNLRTWETMFKDYLDQPPPTPIRPQIFPHSSPDAPFSFTHDPILDAKQKALTAQQEEEARARREAERLAAEEARNLAAARAIAAARTKTTRWFHRVLDPLLALAVLGAAAQWVIAKKSEKDNDAALAREDARLERRAELEQYRDQLRTDMGEMEVDLETLIGEVAEEAVNEGLKNQEGIDKYIKYGDFTLLYQTIVDIFNEKLGGPELRMEEMLIDVIPENEGAGPPHLYTLEIKYSVREMDRGVTHKRALLRKHVPFDTSYHLQ